MNSIWNNNLKFFTQRFPQLAKLYKNIIKDVEKNASSTSQNLPPSPDFWQLNFAKNGEVTANENNLHLHSAYNPSREAQTAVTQDKIWIKSTTVFYGFGLGYHVIEWTKRNLQLTDKKKLILIEPDPFRFFYALAILDWTSVFQNPQLIIALNCPPDQIIALLEDSAKINVDNSGTSDTYFFDIPAFTNHEALYFNTIKTLVQRNIQKNQINAATLKKFGKLWVRNSLKNLDKVLELDNIKKLKNKNCSNLPFVIVGAGPSLQNLLPYLKEIQNRSIIVCVETALHTLLRNHIQPDFIILLDSQYWAYRHISGLSAPESILITEQSVVPAVFRFKCKKILLCASQFCVGQYFQKKLNLDLGDLGTGGSVACSAWNFAHFCGAKTIYLAGVDLGFPEKQTHIKGSSAEQTFHKVSLRTHTAEQYGISSLFSANAVPAKNYKGNPLITDSRMKMFAWWFESRIAACPETATFTLCPEGLQIPGVKVCNIQDFLQLPECSQQKAGFMELAAGVGASAGGSLTAGPATETAADVGAAAAGDSVTVNSDFLNLKQNFPQNTDFFIHYPFLKEYF